MAFVPTILSGAVGDKSMGKPAPNKPDDVKRIQALLKNIFGASCPALKDGDCDANMKAAITDFQKLWPGIADSTVDKAGHTLQRLDRLANPLVLKPITICNVAHGGYTIGYTTCDGGPLPSAGKGFTLHLLFKDDMHSLEVEDHPHNLLNKHNLGDVLKILEQLVCWATPVSCRLQLRYKGAAITTSSPQTFTAPVQPHNGKMLPLDETNNGPKLTYQGNPSAHDFHGRMFAVIEGYDKNLFIYGGEPETDNNFRGFDCITYAGTTCGASTLHMADSGDLADSLDAAAVDLTHKAIDPMTGKETTTIVHLDDADPEYVKEFFKNTTTGYFLLYSTGHIVIVANGVVHEFKGSDPSGYNQTPVNTWLEPYKTLKLTVRRLANKPARAV